MTKRRKSVRKVTKRKTKKTSSTKNYNQQAQWKAYKQLQARADKAWKKFQTDVKKKASSEILVKDQNQLLLLLGECNYMARECMRMAAKRKKRK